MKTPESAPTPEQPVFIKTNPKEGLVCYTFDGVVVKIYRNPEDSREYPQIFFGTFDRGTSAPDDDSLAAQPLHTRDGITMKYVTQCVQEAVKESGLKAFWFLPSGKDDKDGEKRRLARLRLFRRYFPNIETAPGGFGYIVSTEM